LAEHLKDAAAPQRLQGRQMGSRRYLPIIRILNDPGTIGPRRGRPGGPGGALGDGGSNCAVMVKMRLVRVSSARVLATFIVDSVCSTANRVGLRSLMKVMVPPVSALIASSVAGLKATVSTPSPVGRVVMMCPSRALRITTVGEGWR
jgi:hypothetical protein